MGAVVRAAERGLGVALVPQVLCESLLRTGALVRVFAVQLATDEFLLSGEPAEGCGEAAGQGPTRWALAEYQRGEHSSCVAPILFVCRVTGRFVSSPTRRRRAAQCYPAELTGATTMFIHRNRGRNAQAVSLGILAAALIARWPPPPTRRTPSCSSPTATAPAGTQIANGEYCTRLAGGVRRRPEGADARSAGTRHQSLRGLRDERSSCPRRARPVTAPCRAALGGQQRRASVRRHAARAMWPPPWPTPTARCCTG